MQNKMKNLMKNYNHRTHCETEDEEEIILGEIEKMFPTDVDNDFGEFIQSNSLEKIIKKATPKKSNKSVDILSMEDMKLLCKSFTDIMHKFSRFAPHHFDGIIVSIFKILLLSQILLLQSQNDWYQY